ncbi:MAG: hypothetical protein AAF639_28645, partial [Chloroflexota bacterium]
ILFYKHGTIDQKPYVNYTIILFCIANEIKDSLVSRYLDSNTISVKNVSPKQRGNHQLHPICGQFEIDVFFIKAVPSYDLQALFDVL